MAGRRIAGQRRVRGLLTLGRDPAAIRLGACLSLTGRYARFGRQAAAGLRAWRSLAGPGYELTLVDDGSDPARLRADLPKVIARCDLLLGPYGTGLTRAAGEVVRETDRLLWNHGGAGDDVQQLAPGRIVSVLAPASRYARPFVALCAAHAPRRPLRIVRGPGDFARQVAAGALAEAHRHGLEAIELGSGRDPFARLPPAWDLFSVGRFEDDVATVRAARTLSVAPGVIGSVAAGVRDFAAAVPDHDGIYGIAQWAPGTGATEDPVAVGPAEGAFIAAYAELTGRAPDYVAVQAAAAASLAVHCARIAGSATAAALWAAARELHTTTLLGPFAIDGGGRQSALAPVLMRWADSELAPVSV